MKKWILEEVNEERETTVLIYSEVSVVGVEGWVWESLKKK